MQYAHVTANASRKLLACRNRRSAWRRLVSQEAQAFLEATEDKEFEREENEEIEKGKPKAAETEDED